MTEPEELQAQIDALRLLVFSLIAQSPTDALIKDSEIRFEAWEDMHLPSTVSDSYLNLIRAEKVRALQSLQTLRDQHNERKVQAPPDTNFDPKPKRGKQKLK